MRHAFCHMLRKVNVLNLILDFLRRFVNVRRGATLSATWCFVRLQKLINTDVALRIAIVPISCSGSSEFKNIYCMITWTFSECETPSRFKLLSHSLNEYHFTWNTQSPVLKYSSSRKYVNLFTRCSRKIQDAPEKSL